MLQSVETLSVCVFSPIPSAFSISSSTSIHSTNTTEGGNIPLLLSPPSNPYVTSPPPPRKPALKFAPLISEFQSGESVFKPRSPEGEKGVRSPKSFTCNSPSPPPLVRAPPHPSRYLPRGAIHARVSRRNARRPARTCSVVPRRRAEALRAQRLEADGSRQDRREPSAAGGEPSRAEPSRAAAEIARPKSASECLSQMTRRGHHRRPGSVLGT